jgi:hypothetical protein
VREARAGGGGAKEREPPSPRNAEMGRARGGVSLSFLILSFPSAHYGAHARSPTDGRAFMRHLTSRLAASVLGLVSHSVRASSGSSHATPMISLFSSSSPAGRAGAAPGRRTVAQTVRQPTRLT